MGQSIVVTSGKGGTGKTSVTAGVGACLAALGHKTVLIDADAGFRSLDLLLGLGDRAVFDWGDVLQNRASLSDALILHPEIPRLYLLPAPSVLTPVELDAAAFRAMVRTLRDRYDFVLVDSPAGLEYGFHLACGACDAAVIVTATDNLAVRQAGITALMLRDKFKMTDVRLVVNRVRPRLVNLRHSQNIDDVMDKTGLGLLGLVPEDELVMAASNLGHPVVLASHNGAAVSYLNIARRLLGEHVELAKMKQWKVE